MLISDQYLQTLKEKGLIVSDPFPSGHIAYPDGVFILKPVNVPGNSIEGLESVCIDYDEVNDIEHIIKCNTPSVYIHSADKKWFVTVHQYEPGPGPGDFINQHDSIDNAIADVIDFFFGKPERMNACST